MTNPPEGQDDEEQREANRQSDAMKAQLRKDVDSWSRARSEPSAERHAEESASAPRAPSLPIPVDGAKKTRTPRPAAKDSLSPKKPFSMSYDGVSSAEYIQYMIDRGSR